MLIRDNYGLNYLINTNQMPFRLDEYLAMMYLCSLPHRFIKAEPLDTAEEYSYMDIFKILYN
jgi:hypothetical protein